MKKPNISLIMSSLSNNMVKHSPELLTGLGITGMITATVLAVKVTPKALILLENEKRRQNREILDAATKNGDDCCQRIDKLKPIEVVKTTWKCYLPTVISTGLSVACLIGANSVNIKRNAALATAYTLSESALREYRSKVVETIGDKKEQTIRESISKDKLDNDPVSKHKIIRTGNGDTMCYDAMSGRYFMSDIESLKRAENELNKLMLEEDYVSLNDLYDRIGLDGIKIGEDIGWHIDHGLMELDFSSHLSTDGNPCLVMDFRVAPRNL